MSTPHRILAMLCLYSDLTYELVGRLLRNSFIRNFLVMGLAIAGILYSTGIESAWGNRILGFCVGLFLTGLVLTLVEAFDPRHNVDILDTAA